MKTTYLFALPVPEYDRLERDEDINASVSPMDKLVI